MKIWFQNRRYKTKRKQILHQQDILTASTSPGPAKKVAVKVVMKDDRVLYKNEMQQQPRFPPLPPLFPAAAAAYYYYYQNPHLYPPSGPSGTASSGDGSPPPPDCSRSISPVDIN